MVRAASSLLCLAVLLMTQSLSRAQSPPPLDSPASVADLSLTPPCPDTESNDLLRQVVESLAIPFALPACADGTFASEPQLFDLLMPRERFGLSDVPHPPPPAVFQFRIERVRANDDSPNLPPHISVSKDNIQYVPGPPPALLDAPLPPRTQDSRNPPAVEFTDDVQFMPIPTALAPLPRTKEPVSDIEQTAASTETMPTVERAEHLREAARHLEAAGHDDAAALFREEADGLLAASIEMLNRKRAKLQQLQQEVADLERATGHYQQVLLQCRCIELDEDALGRMQVVWNLLFGHEDADTSVGFPTGIHSSKEIAVLVDTLVFDGHAKIVAEPSLEARIGEPATYRSGGEFPIVIPDGQGNATIEWREFGVKLEAVAQILRNGKIHLEVAPEISERDFENSVEMNGSVIPGIRVRRTNTSAEMEFGQSLVVGGYEPQEQAIQQTSTDDSPKRSRKTFLFIITPEPFTGKSPAPWSHLEEADSVTDSASE